jgi:hypothetical protein
MTRKSMEPVDFDAVFRTAQDAAARAGVSFQHRIEQQAPATSLVIDASDSDAARVIVSAVDPGTLYLDIGVGMHGEWLLRSHDQLHRALTDLGRIFEGIFRGQVVEDVRKRFGSRLSIHGSAVTPTKTYKFTHHAVGISANPGVRRYKAYPSLVC